MLIHQFLSAAALWWTLWCIIFIFIITGGFESFIPLEEIQVSKCWCEQYLMHVICITLQPVFESAAGLFLSSLICLSNNAVQLFPPHQPSISLSQNMNMKTHSDSAKECRRGRTAPPTLLTGSPSQTGNRSAALNSTLWTPHSINIQATELQTHWWVWHNKTGEFKNMIYLYLYAYICLDFLSMLLSKATSPHVFFWFDDTISKISLYIIYFYKSLLQK